MFVALINNGVRLSREIWRAKMPMKIKIFIWYLKRGVILTKDNLSRRNWNGEKIYSFCYINESIQHLFFNCAYANFLWRAVHLLFGIPRPINIHDLFNRWCKLGRSKYNPPLLNAAAALCWTLWVIKNEVVFDRCKPKTFLQVLFGGTHWLRQWTQLQRHDDQELLLQAARLLEEAALLFFCVVWLVIYLSDWSPLVILRCLFKFSLDAFVVIIWSDSTLIRWSPIFILYLKKGRVEKKNI
jgi:hypothetical protein